MIKIDGLTKKYGKNTALDNVSFNVNKGEILGFLGPNGAGKSTTMNIITGYLSATSGSVKVNGFDNVTDSFKCRKTIGYLPETPPLYNDMTVNEYLSFVYEIKQADQPKKQHIDNVLTTVGIIDVKDRLIKNLSKGYKQRVGIAQALIGDPQVLILDEPTVGLDPKQINEIRNVIKTLAKEHTVILSTHILPEVSAVCDRVVIINKGKIVAQDTIENLSKHIGNNTFSLRVKGDREHIKQVICSVEGIMNITYTGCFEDGACDFVIDVESESDVRTTLFNVLAQNGLDVLMFKNNEVNLEEIFLKITENPDSKGGKN